MRLAALLALALALPMSALAAPGELSHQGRLIDSAGTPLSGDHAITFTLYDDASSGNALWTETLTASFEDGHFSVVLGADSPFEAGDFDGSTRYLGLAVDGGTELSPRISVVSVPYAIHAGSADTATSADTALTAESVTGGSVNATSVTVAGSEVIASDGTIDFSHLVNVPSGTVDSFADLLSDCSGTDDAITFDGTGWVCGGLSADTLDRGTLSLDRIPVGTSDATVAAGDHSHTGFGTLTVSDLTADSLTVGSTSVSAAELQFLSAWIDAAETCTAGQAVVLNDDEDGWACGDGSPPVPPVDVVFGTCGLTGAAGPNQAACDSDYSGTDLSGVVQVVSGYQRWTVPDTSNYRITARGSRSGTHSNGAPGLGAEVAGTFALNAGDELIIVTGQAGYTNSSCADWGAGGGGGTFVAKVVSGSGEALSTVGVSVVPLIVAGGGGGVRDNSGGCDRDGFPGLATLSSDPSGGVGGGNATGGGGWSGNGSASGGLSFLNGATGCTRYSGRLGGFGGGGCPYNGGGGGGGYQGGENIGGDGDARGGLSFNGGSSPTGSDGAWDGEGQVTIVEQ